MLTRTNPRTVLRTSLKGYVAVEFDDLVEAFGDPNCKTDGYKTDAEWCLKDEVGNIVVIYNYKTGKNYLGTEGVDLLDEVQWHVAGTADDTLDILSKALYNANICNAQFADVGEPIPTHTFLLD